VLLTADQIAYAKVQGTHSLQPVPSHQGSTNKVSLGFLEAAHDLIESRDHACDVDFTIEKTAWTPGISSNTTRAVQGGIEVYTPDLRQDRRTGTSPDPPNPVPTVSAEVNIGDMRGNAIRWSDRLDGSQSTRTSSRLCVTAGGYASENNKGPFTREYKAYDNIWKATTVVLTKDEIWVEMRCPLRRGNANRHSLFVNGIRRLKLHVRKGHGSKGAEIASLDQEAFIKKCEYAIVSDETAILYENWPSKVDDNDDDPVKGILWGAATGSSQEDEQTAATDSCSLMVSEPPSEPPSEAQPVSAATAPLTQSCDRSSKRSFSDYASDIGQQSGSLDRATRTSDPLDGGFRQETRDSAKNGSKTAKRLVRRVSRTG